MHFVGAPTKSIGAPAKSVGAPIKKIGDTYKIDRLALILLWRSIHTAKFYEKQKTASITESRLYNF